MGDKEAIEAMKALHEIGELLAEGQAKLHGYLKIMDGFADGTNTLALFEVIDKVTEEPEDDIQSMLIVAIGTLARVREAIKGTTLEKDLSRPLWGKKMDMSQAGEH